MNSQKNISGSDFLVLMDFSESSYIALKYAISMAKLTNNKIHVCHVGNIGKVVISDNQTVALRAIESENTKIMDKLGSIVETITTEGISANCIYTFGNIINELESLAEQFRPKLIVMGKKKENSTFSGKLTKYLLNKYPGSILIVGKENEFHVNTKIALGCNSNTLYQYSPLIISELDKHTKPTLTLVNNKKISEKQEIIDLPKTWQASYTIGLNLQLKHLESSSIANGLITHLSEENIQLLCIGRGRRRNYLQNLFSKQTSTLSQLVKKVHTPLLIMGKNSN